MATAVRVQGPGAAITLSFEDGATLDDLRQRIASSELAIPASLQELRVGFPPQVLGAAGSALMEEGVWQVHTHVWRHAYRHVYRHV